MSDINDADDLLNCELLGELDEHALLGDEDDLLLSDEEIDKDESKKKSENKFLSKSNDTNKSKDKKHVDGKSGIKSSVATKLKDKVKHKIDTVKIKKKIEELQAEPKVSTSSTLTGDNSKTEEKIIELISNKCEDERKSQNDEVSSTNKEIKSIAITLKIKKDFLPVSQGSSNLDELNYEPDVRDEDSEENSGERLNIKQSSEREDLISSSPEKHQPNIRFPFVKRGRGRGGGPPFLPRTHMPNIRLPFNNRHTIGGDNSNPQQAMQHVQYPSSSLLPYSNEMQSKIPLSRQPYPPSNHMMNPRMEFPLHRPMGPNFIPPNPNENIIGPRMYGQRHPPPNGIMPSYNGQQPGNMMRPMFRPSDPNQLRPRMPLRPQPPVPLGIQNNPNYMPQVTQIPQPHLIPSNMGGTSHQNPPSNSSVLPRKVLINPNFKGGVEAATNQLMKDTQFIQTISSHVSHLQSDEELLRQQEEFIKKNQIQIDKRRYARSPGRSRSRSRSRSRGRVRSRERSYSPPRRRDFYRERRGGGFRGAGARNRRANSRDWENDRKRRSFTPDRKDKERNNEEEDEETRAYRLEIEKQKAMREKILKDKEMRRRKAAEDKLNEDKIEEPTKLKPIVVTQSKIISLKKVKEKNELESGTQNNNNSKVQRNTTANTKKSPVVAATKLSNENNSPQRAIKRSIPTAKILPDAKRSLTEHIKKDIAVSTTLTSSGTIKSTAQSTTSSTTAIVKPVLKKSTTVQTEFSKNKQANLIHSDDILEDYDDELLEEDRLLASPTPSPSNTPELEQDDDDDDNEDNIHIKNNKFNNSDGDDDNDDDDEDFVNDELKNTKKTFMSSNRKVLLKPFHKNENKVDTTTTKKRVFDRLEKPRPKVGVKESAKKRIQRIIE